jgi:hypothetical protein
MSSGCHYCGADPGRRTRTKNGAGAFLGNGIDRVENQWGYETANVVACCSRCNYAKRDMPTADFLAWAEAIHRHSSARRG